MSSSLPAEFASQDASTIASSECASSNTCAILDSIQTLRADTDAMHQQLVANIRKQQADLDALLQAHQRLQQYHTNITNALTDFVKCHLAPPLAPNDIADGAIVHAAAASTATLKCVGKPDLTNEALKIYTLAANKDDRKSMQIQQPRNTTQQRTPLTQSFHGAKRAKNDPTLRSLLINKQQAPPVSVLPILQNLLGCATWKKTLQFVNTARGVPLGDARGVPVGDARGVPVGDGSVVASVAGRPLPPPTGVNSKILERLVPSIFSPARLDSSTPASPTKPSVLLGNTGDTIRSYLAQEILKRGRLLGRDDHLFIDVFESRDGNSVGVLRAEVIAVDKKLKTDDQGYYNSCTKPVQEFRLTSYAPEVEAILNWAESECTKIGRPNFCRDAIDPEEENDSDFWGGSIEDLKVDPSPPDKQGSMRYIQLASSDRCNRTESNLDDFAQNVSERGWMSSRWISIFFGNGLWKAELLIDEGTTKSCYQKSLKQLPYQRAQHQVLAWLCRNAQLHDIKSFRYKAKGEECSFLVPPADETSESEEDDEVRQRKRQRAEAHAECPRGMRKRRQSNQGLT